MLRVSKSESWNLDYDVGPTPRHLGRKLQGRTYEFFEGRGVMVQVRGNFHILTSGEKPLRGVTP